MKKKILIVIQLIRRGGVELVAINFARNLDKSKFDITFLLVNPEENQDEILLNELKSEGFNFIEMPIDVSGYFGKYRFMNEIMREENFHIVHSHVIFFSGLVLKCAKKNGVKVRVAHSHIMKWNRNENIKYKLYKYVMQKLINKYANHKLACCLAAGEFLFGKKEYDKNGSFIANGIDTKKFEYSQSSRNLIRNEFNFSEDTLLIGHVGTVYKIKNQVFLVEILNEILKSNRDAKLLLVGEEVDVQPVIDKAQKLDILDKVIFAGQRNDIENFYQAFDMLIFPSLHEALPVSLVEAQASKLPCLISDTVTTEVKYNENVDFISLSKTPAEWTAKAFELLNFDREQISTDRLVNSYDINIVAQDLEKIYLS